MSKKPPHFFKKMYSINRYTDRIDTLRTFSAFLANGLDLHLVGNGFVQTYDDTVSKFLPQTFSIAGPQTGSANDDAAVVSTTGTLGRNICVKTVL